MDACMDAWRHGWMDEWMNGWMDAIGWMDIWMEAWMDDAWWMHRCMDGCMDRQIELILYYQLQQDISDLFKDTNMDISIHEVFYSYYICIIRIVFIFCWPHFLLDWKINIILEMER